MKFILGFLFALVPLSSIAKHVVVDIGHSPASPGTISSYGRIEYSYNQDLGVDIAKSLVKIKNKVDLISYSGEPITLEQRTELVKAAKPNLLISIHHDSVAVEDLKTWEFEGKPFYYNDNVRGFSVFVSTKNPNLSKSMACAVSISEQLLLAGFKPNYYHANPPFGKKRELFFSNRPIYQYDNLVILKKSEVPAILIEAGVLINRQEALWIAQENVRLTFANAVAKGTDECLIS